MTPHFAGWDERALDLAIDRCTVGLDGRDQETLELLVEDADFQRFEDAVSAVQLASLQDLEVPSADFLGRLEHLGRQQVLEDARTSKPRSVSPAPSASSAGARALALGGWLAAAALLLVFLAVRSENEPDARALREALVADAGDVVRVAWTATEDPAAAGASGDVVWSTSRQQGYMRFENLAPNVPEESQYQLWIFDPTRADWEAKPVDGGVFDVPGDGEVVVPIDAKLDVRQTALFAVTIEVPGGVVVSERERLVLTAQL